MENNETFSKGGFLKVFFYGFRVECQVIALRGWSIQLGTAALGSDKFNLEAMDSTKHIVFNSPCQVAAHVQNRLDTLNRDQCQVKCIL